MGDSRPTERSVEYPDQDVVATAAEAATAARPPLVVLEPLAAFLDENGLGTGELSVRPIGEGHSNVSYEIRRDGARLVLRRPPRGPLAPSTHDVAREARLLERLEPVGVRVPRVRAICDDDAVIGAPFYVMDFIEGDVLMTRLPGDPDAFGPPARAMVGPQLVDALIELHAVDVEAAGLGDLGRASGYLERQLDRFEGQLESSATRELTALEEVAEWLRANRPQSPTPTVVHGDYRLGNAMFDLTSEGARLRAVLDWEMSTIGDPLADVGYMTAMWSEPGDPDNPMFDLSLVTRLAGFGDRAELARLYAERTGRDLGALAWYQVLGLWKATIFLEASYGRYLAGNTDDHYFARLGDGVPRLADYALALARSA